MASFFAKFLDQTRYTTVGSTPLEEWSARRRDLYLTTHNNHKRQSSMPPVGFELTISASERPQTHALDRAATWTGTRSLKVSYINFIHCNQSIRDVSTCRQTHWPEVVYWMKVTSLTRQIYDKLKKKKKKRELNDLYCPPSTVWVINREERDWRGM